MDPDSICCAKLFESNTSSLFSCVINDVLVFLGNAERNVDTMSTKFLNACFARAAVCVARACLMNYRTSECSLLLLSIIVISLTVVCLSYSVFFSLYFISATMNRGFCALIAARHFAMKEEFWSVSKCVCV